MSSSCFLSFPLKESILIGRYRGEHRQPSVPLSQSLSIRVSVLLVNCNAGGTMAGRAGHVKEKLQDEISIGVSVCTCS